MIATEVGEALLRLMPVPRRGAKRDEVGQWASLANALIIRLPGVEWEELCMAESDNSATILVMHTRCLNRI